MDVPHRPLLALLAACTALAAAPPAGAVDVQVSGRIVRGDLSAVFPPAQIALDPVSLDAGGDRDVSVSLPFTVTDARGSGDGWHLSVSTGGVVQDGVALPGSAARIDGVTAACSAGDPCTLPDDRVAYPVAVGDAPTPFFTAAGGTGLGTTDLAATLVLTLPGNARAGTYATTLTLAHAAGP